MIETPLYRLEREQIVGLGITEAWSFFSDPRNLSRITPPAMNFSILSSVPERIYPGLLIEYRLTPVGPLPMRWVTEITHVREPYYFVDEQRFGPYLFWHHQHHLEEVAGGTRIRDIVHYKLRMGIVGRLIHAIHVRREIEAVFLFREKILQDLFGGKLK